MIFVLEKLLYKYVFLCQSLFCDLIEFEVNMKGKWKNEEIKKLFDCVEKGNKKNLSVLDSFRLFAKNSNRNALSVRNFYYAYVKELKANSDLCKELNIDITKHDIQKFRHFDDFDEKKLTEKIENLLADGMSIRGACLKLADGNATEMLRLQNKYRNIKKETKVFNFPIKNSEKLQKTGQKIDFSIENQNVKLTDDDIKSLFLGLVNLVKETAKEDNKSQIEKMVIKTEEENRKHLVELEQKQNEIERLKKYALELQEKNKSLSTALKNYRVDFLSKNQSNFTNPNNNI